VASRLAALRLNIFSSWRIPLLARHGQSRTHRVKRISRASVQVAGEYRIIEFRDCATIEKTEFRESMVEIRGRSSARR